MRASTLLNRVFDLPGVRVTGVDLGEVDGTGQVVVEVALRARLLACPACSFTTSRRYDRRDVDSSWRHLDLGGRVCRLRMRRRRLRCPTHGVVTRPGPGMLALDEAVVDSQRVDKDSVPDGSPMWRDLLPEHGGHQLAPAVDPGLGEDRLDVVVDGVDGDAQAVRDGLGWHAA